MSGHATVTDYSGLFRNVTIGPKWPRMTSHLMIVFMKASVRANLCFGCQKLVPYTKPSQHQNRWRDLVEGLQSAMVHLCSEPYGSHRKEVIVGKLRSVFQLVGCKTVLCGVRSV